MAGDFLVSSDPILLPIYVYSIDIAHFRLSRVAARRINNDLLRDDDDGAVDEEEEPHCSPSPHGPLNTPASVYVVSCTYMCYLLVRV